MNSGAGVSAGHWSTTGTEAGPTNGLALAVHSHVARDSLRFAGGQPSAPTIVALVDILPVTSRNEFRRKQARRLSHQYCPEYVTAFMP